MKRAANQPSRSFTMDMSNGKSSTSSIEDYSLITSEKCSPPRAKLFMVSIISFVVATLVVLLVVLTQVEQKTTPTEHYSEPDVCPDVAIVGAGLAGTYAAYQLAALNFSIQLFEMSDRLGGRLTTRHFVNASNINLELGPAYWIPRLHRKMDSIVDKLNLTRVSYLPSFNANDVLYNLRNLNLKAADLNSTKSPYNLDEKEKKRFPYELYRWYLEGDPIVEPEENETLSVEADTIELGVSLKDLLRERASPEGLAFIKAATEPYEMYSGGDAGVFFDYLLSLGDYKTGGVGERTTVKEGMEMVPNRLVNDLQNTDRWNALNMHHRLTKLESENGIHRLYFTLTESTNGGTIDTEDTEFTCAKRVILALPPKALQQLKWAPIDSDRKLYENLHSVIAIPAIKIYLAYTTPWWKELDKPWKSVRTDLPLKRVDVIYEANDISNSTEGSGGNSTDPDTDSEEEQKLSVIMASFAAHEDYNYWDVMTTDSDSEVFQGSYESQPPVTVKMIDLIQRHLARISGTSMASLPLPKYATYHKWKGYPYGGAWHVWKPGSDYTTIANQMIRPGQDQNIHIVGGAFAQSFLQLTLEGDLQTVDNLIEKHFDVEDPFFDLMRAG